MIYIDKVKQVYEKAFQYRDISVFIGLLFVSVFGIFNRTMKYHDEIINVYKANHQIIFDYTCRPVSFAFQSLSILLFGDSFYSLVLMGGLAAAATAYIVYLTSSLVCRSILLNLSAAVFCLSFVNFHIISISSMVHVYTSLFISISLYQMVVILKRSSDRWLDFVLFGIFTGLTLATHPVAIAFVFAAFVAIFFYAAFGLRQGRRVLLKRVKLFLLASASFVVCMLIIDIIGQMIGNNSLISNLAGAFGSNGKIHSQRYGYYHKPFWFYLVEIWNRSSGMVCCAVVAFTSIVILSLINLRKIVKDQLNVTWLVVFCVGLVMIITTLVISGVSWKFSRILASFSPIYALFTICLILMIIEFMRCNYPVKKLGIISVAIGFIVFIVALFSMETVIKYNLINAPKYRHKYSVYYEIPRLLPTTGYYVVAEKMTPSRKAIVSMHIEATGKKFLGAIETDKLTGPRGLLAKLPKNKSHFIYYITKNKAKEKAEYKKFRDLPNTVMVFNWRGLVEIWRIEPIKSLSGQ